MMRSFGCVDLLLTVFRITAGFLFGKGRFFTARVFTNTFLFDLFDRDLAITLN